MVCEDNRVLNPQRLYMSLLCYILGKASIEVEMECDIANLRRSRKKTIQIF